VENKLTYSRIKNPKGEFVYPTVSSARDCAASTELPANLCGMVSNGANGYPITGMTYLIAYKNSRQAKDLKGFLKWAITKGQDYANDLYYAAIPETLRKKEIKMIDSIE
jgi:phosphate transport system substrate-binding protein